MQLANAFCFMRIHLTYSYASSKMREHKLQTNSIKYCIMSMSTFNIVFVS